MNRREFVLLTGAAAAATLLRAPVLAQTGGYSTMVSAQAAELYRRALVLDCNSAPPFEGGKLPLPQADLDMARNCGVNVVKVTLGGINEGLADTVGDISYIERMIEVHPDYFLEVRVPADMQRAKREQKMGIILSFESADMLEGRLDNIELFRNLGVRVMQLSYNKKSPFGAGVMAPDGGGLTALGRQAVAKMNTFGVAIDVSHANAQTTNDALAASTKPVLITHAGCTAIHPHPRNKTDEQIRAVAVKGGVMGIYDLPYLTASPKQPTVEDYMAHMEHALKVAGEDHVGVGSDMGVQPFDASPKSMAEFHKNEAERQQAGLAAPEEDRPPYVEGMNTPRKIEIITDQLLKRGYPARVAEKVLGGNFVRVLTEIWT